MPVVMSFLEAFPTLERVMVMVQLEVAERLAAQLGSKVYGVSSVKGAWYAAVRLAGTVAPKRVLAGPERRLGAGRARTPPRTRHRSHAPRHLPCIDAAFAPRRKTLRAALSGWAGSAVRAEECLRAAGVDPKTRGEQLGIEAFAATAAAHTELPSA